MLTYDIISAPPLTDARAVHFGFTNAADLFWLDDVRCVGSEATLASCPHSDFGGHDCGNFYEAGVQCLEPLITSMFPVATIVNPKL